MDTPKEFLKVQTRRRHGGRFQFVECRSQTRRLWWRVALHHIFPPGGRTLRIELGDQITKKNTLTQCEENRESVNRCPLLF
jgi:hypothetical protein